MMRQCGGIFTEITESYQTLAGASEVCVQAGTEGVPEDAVSVVIPDAVMYIPLEDLVDFEKEKERLTKEKENWKRNLREARVCFPMRKFLNKARQKRWLRSARRWINTSR